MMDVDAIQRALGYTFRNRDVLLRALTHRSWIEEQYPGRGAEYAHLDQQRLEFLGDAYLGYVVGRWLFDQDASANEGTLTRARAELVCKSALVEAGEQWGILGQLRLGVGERQNAQKNHRLVPDTVEALIGAMIVDGAEDAARSLILSWMERRSGGAVTRDPISEVNERHMKRYKSAPPEPDYERVQGTADHAPRWSATVRFGELVAVAEGDTKRDARAAACLQIVAWIGGE